METFAVRGSGSQQGDLLLLAGSTRDKAGRKKANKTADYYFYRFQKRSPAVKQGIDLYPFL